MGDKGRINRQIRLKSIIIIMQGKQFLAESANSQILQDSSTSSAPLNRFIHQTDSIILQSHQQSKPTTTIQQRPPKQSPLMGNVPLLLQKRKAGIIEDNMISSDHGLEKWRFGKMIGGGGSGRVYRTLNAQTGCLYAVKKIHLCEEDQMECKTQINILSKISHDNIVRYVEHYHLSDQTLIFMQYVPGTLKKFYKDFGPPPLQTYLYFAKQLVVALDYLHNHKIIHKDLKCANVLLTNKGIIKLSDFGCSKSFDRTISFVKYQVQGSKTQKGTPHWMAPESVEDTKYNVQTDVWGLGCTLLELATGNLPWAQKKLDNNKIIIAIGMTKEVPHIPEDLPELVKDIISSCLKRQPEQRISLKQLLKVIQRGT